MQVDSRDKTFAALGSKMARKDDKGCGKKRCKNYCVKYRRYCWCADPKPRHRSCPYNRDTICNIRTGSLVHISKVDPLSMIMTFFDGTPYNLHGYIVQFPHDKGGTRVYTVDHFYTREEGDHDTIMSHVTTIPLIDFMENPSVNAIAISELLDFDVKCESHDSIPEWPKDERIGQAYPGGNGYEGARQMINAYRAGHHDESWSDQGWGYKKGKKHGDKGGDKGKKCKKDKKGYKPSHCGPEKPSKMCLKTLSSPSCSSSSSSSSVSSVSSNTSCSFSYYGCEIDSAEKWGKQQSFTRREILKERFNAYYGLSSETDDYQFVAGRILGAPIAEEYRTKASFTDTELVTEIGLETGLMWDRNYSLEGRNPICCFDTCYWNDFVEKAGDKCSELETVLAFLSPLAPCFEEVCSYAKACRSKKQCDSHDDSHPSQDSHHDSHSSNDSHHDHDQIDKKIRQHLRQFDRDMYYLGKNCSNPESLYAEVMNEGDKGGNCHSSSGKRKGGCHHSSSSSSSCSSSSSSKYKYVKPKLVTCYSKTVLTGSVRSSNLLYRHYQHKGIDYKGFNDLCDLEGKLCKYSGIQGDAIAAVADLATKRAAGAIRSFDFVRLEMPWFDSMLTRVDLCPKRGRRIECDLECDLINRLFCSYEKSALQKQMLNQDALALSGSALMTISKFLTEYRNRLHDLASDCDGAVKWRDHSWDCESFVEESKDEDVSEHCSLPLFGPCVGEKREPCYPVYCQKYMHDTHWKFDCKKRSKCDYKTLKKAACELKDVIQGLQDLYVEVPLNSILRDLIHHDRNQAKCFYRWICHEAHRCRKYGRKEKKHHHRHEKHSSGW